MSGGRRLKCICGLWAVLMAHSAVCCAQTLYKFRSDSAFICFTDKNISQYIPHVVRKYQTSRLLHNQIWDGLPSQIPFMLLYDMGDDGNAGVSAVPHTYIQMSVAPLNMAFFSSAATEHYDFVFKHEYTHVVMHDKANSKDAAWRRFTGNKVVPNSKYPLSAFWSYKDAPRVFTPRWYHEGIACFMETWLSGGAGRSLGGYDETYFRTRVKEGAKMYSIVGLETEGSTADIEQGSTGYLYGTRFINYLVLAYGYDKLIRFYNRTDDSETFYAKQFEKVYGKKLKEVWEEWQDYERVHQQENLDAIAEYPLTGFHKIVDRNLGMMSPLIVDEEKRIAYAVTNHQGDFSQVVRISLDDKVKPEARIRKLCHIDGSSMHQPAYIAYDRINGRLIWTDRNSKYRGLVVYDIEKGKVTERLKLKRTYDICYDNANDCLYGLLSSGGRILLVKYGPDLGTPEILYSFPFGLSVSDLDVSHDGRHLVCSLLGTKGEHSLIMFDTGQMENAGMGYETLYSFEDSNLSQFRFSADDTKLIGFSYYTGVPNIWSYDFASGDINLVTNVQTGVFAPYLASDNTVYALEYSEDGMTPVTFEYQELHDANSVEFLGQKAYDANPEIAGLGVLKTDMPEISFGEVYDSITVYRPFREARFQGIYPDISGFTDRQAWNNVTPVLGAHLSFYDPLSMFSANFFVGASPWSHNDWKNKFHINADLKYRRWSFNAAWNPTDFYDLFGPRRTSRKGYTVSLSYDYKNILISPAIREWGVSVAHYGAMDALPLYQEIEVDEGITSFQTASLYYNGGKVRSSLGAIEAEQGFKYSGSAYSYLAGGKLFPQLEVSADAGFLIPGGGHNLIWFKAAAGQSFGDPDSALGNTYFGGFRNNYVDYGAANRFRTVSSMPGFRIDQIAAHSYAKLNGEVDFTPIRLQNFGALQCYPNYIQFIVFGKGLMTNLWEDLDTGQALYYSAGAQMNIQMVFFTHMKATLSFGYARGWAEGLNQGEFMVSLKLL